MEPWLCTARCPVAGREWSAPTHLSWVAGFGPGRATYGAPDVFTGLDATCTSIAPGTTVLPLSAFVAGSGLAGLSITVTASIDPDNTIPEADETNNSFSQTFQT